MNKLIKAYIATAAAISLGCSGFGLLPGTHPDLLLTGPLLFLYAMALLGIPVLGFKAMIYTLKSLRRAWLNPHQ